jgi:hypothetical protein
MRKTLHWGFAHLGANPGFFVGAQWERAPVKVFH